MFDKIIDAMIAKGRYCFDSSELVLASGKSALAVRRAMRRMRDSGRIAMPIGGFYVYVPPEYRSLGCLPPEQFIPYLMERDREPYYAGLLSAAQFYGSAHQQPQEFHVIVSKVHKPISCGKVRVKFAVRHNAAEIPVVKRNTPRGQIIISTPEATAFDLIGYHKQAGGLNNVATVIASLAEKLDPKLLLKVAELSPVAWSQRLGYLLDYVEAGDKAKGLAKFVKNRTPIPSALMAGKPVKGADRNLKWNVLVNSAIEVDFDS